MTEDEQLEGMDTVLHNETAYESGGLGSSGSLVTGSVSIPEEVDA